VFIQYDEEAADAAKTLNADPEEVKVRTDSNWGYWYFSSDGKWIGVPPRIGSKEIKKWLSRVREPISYATSTREFFDLARKNIKGITDSLVVIVGDIPDWIESKAIDNYMKCFVKVDRAVADRLGIGPGLHISRMYTKYDGDLEVQH
jgi:hypothetical protein